MTTHDSYQSWHTAMMRRPTVNGRIIPIPTFSAILAEVLHPRRYPGLTMTEIGNIAWNTGILPGQWDELAAPILARMMEGK